MSDTCITCRLTADEIVELSGFAMMLARPMSERRNAAEYLECWWCAKERRRQQDDRAAVAIETAERSGA